MKKFVIYLFSSIAIVLVLCTVTSVFVEELMTPRVQTTSASESKEEKFSVVMPVDAVKFTDSGSVFYRIEAGTGWDEGDFVVFDQADIRGVEDGRYICSAQQYTKYVLYSSKPIYDGQEIYTMKGTETHEADILVQIDSDEFLAEAFEGDTYTLIENFGGGSILIRDPSAREYFLAEKVTSYFAQYGITVEDSVRLEDFAQLMKNMPLVASLFLSVGIMLIFWALMLRGIYSHKNLKAVIGTGGITVFFAAYWFIAKIIELPSALLPERTILDFGHYAERTKLITDTLIRIGDTETMALYNNCKIFSAVILALAAVAILIALLMVLVQKREIKEKTTVKNKKQKYTGRHYR